MINIVPENITNGIADLLQNDLPAILTTIETEKADGVSLPALKIIDKGYADIFNRPKYPACGIQVDTVRIESAGQNAMKYDTDVSVVIALADLKPDVLNIKAMRYAEAVREVIQRNASLNNSCLYSHVSNIEFYPAAPGDKYMSIIDVTINAMDEIN